MMKTIFKSFYIGLLASVAMLSTSCSDDSNYKAGPDVDPSVMSVYFQGILEDGKVNTDALHSYTSDDSVAIIQLRRVKTDEAADVPVLIKYKSSYLSMDSVAHFAKGDSIAQLKVDLTRLPNKVVGEVYLAIPDEYTNPYTIKDGGQYMAAQFVVSQWVPCCDIAEVQFLSGLYPTVSTMVYKLEGVNLFKITDFAGSEIDLKFSVDGTYDDSDLTKCKGSIKPLSNCLSTQDPWGWGYPVWYLMYDADAGNYASWTYEDKYPDYKYGIKWIMFFDNYNGNQYNTIDFSTYSTVKRKGVVYNWAYACLTGYVWSTESARDAYQYLYINMYTKASE